MNIIFVTAGSILLIASATYVARKAFNWNICAICAGVSGTWLWMFAGILTYNLPWPGRQPTTYNLAIAMLMGGSVVGIAYQGEKRLPAERSALAWKMICIPLGFAGVLALLQGLWVVSVVAFAIPAAAWIVFFSAAPQSSGSNATEDAVVRIKNQMKNCC